MRLRMIWMLAALALIACDDDGDSALADAAPQAEVGVTPDQGASPTMDEGVEPGLDGGMAPDQGDALTPDDGVGPDPDRGVDPDPDMAAPPPEAAFTADFEGAGPGWPAPWVVSGGVLSATVEDGMGCLVPELSNYSLARMAAPLGLNDAEVLFTLRFSDIAHQGVGFYLRSNGGHLALTDPPGSGYAVFIEGFRRGPGIGVWREIEGDEQDIRITYDEGLALRDGVRYRVRFRMSRRDGATDLRARIWPEGEPEPIAWQVEALDDTPSLQDLPLGIAVDSWNTFNPGDPGPPERGATCVDDIEIRPIAHPLDGVGAPEVIASRLQFTEGPVWDQPNGRLLFTDIPANTIYSLVPGEQPQVAIQPSGFANGLNFAPNGDLLVCEHAGRVVRYADLNGPAELVAEAFDGVELHSPNDIVARSDGTLYFTDPPYGRNGRPGPLPFMGLFRVSPDGAVHAEHRGALEERPNGVVLSPDERRLYLADTQMGTLHMYRVMPDGALADRRLIAENLPFADGMAVAPDGTVFVTSARGVVALDADGNEWGTIELPRQPANCALAPDGTLYVTARDTVYRVPTAGGPR